jgi:hypothetical protein
VQGVDIGTVLEPLSALRDLTLQLLARPAPFPSFGLQADRVLQQLTALNFVCEKAHLLALTQVIICFPAVIVQIANYSYNRILQEAVYLCCSRLFGIM